MTKISNRDRLLSEGLKVVHAHGYAGASVRDIVQAAGVPQGSFTNHFVSKEAFGLEILDIYLANGRNVSPEQVELEYRKYDGVRDAAVFLDEDHGLIALLCVESQPDRSDLAQWSTKRFSDVERPSKLWLLDLANPLLEQLYTVTGRPRRAEIAEAFAHRFSPSMQRTSADEHACLSL